MRERVYSLGVNFHRVYSLGSVHILWGDTSIVFTLYGSVLSIWILIAGAKRSRVLEDEFEKVNRRHGTADTADTARRPNLAVLNFSRNCKKADFKITVFDENTQFCRSFTVWNLLLFDENACFCRSFTI